MFGSNKSNFGFGTTNSAFGNFGSTSTGFGGGTAFGAQTPGASGGGLFGGGASGNTGATGGLFGQSANTGFGQNQNTGFSFGSSTNTSAAGGGLFGSNNNTGGSSLFSTPASGTTFGFGATGFGVNSNQASAAGNAFSGNNAGTASLFGTNTNSAFGASAGGTTVAFNPPTGQDTMMKSGVASNINTRHQCITAMKEYESKSLEELRVEDYAANRKSKQVGSTTATGGLFGQTQATQANTGFGFGAGAGLGSTLQSGNTGFGGFGGTSSAATTPFNQNRPLFGGATTTQSGFGFGSATGTQSNSLFGNTARPLFGGTSSTASTLNTGGGLFGNPASSNTLGGFGQTNTGGLFGAKPAGFGTATTSTTGFNFGGGGSLFNKPTTTASTFGFGTNTSTTGFGNTFNLNKPVGFGAPSTGLTGGTSFGFGAGLGANTNTNTFGAATSKPAFGGFSFGGGAAGTAGFANTGQAGLGTFSGLGAGANTLGAPIGAAQANNAQLQQQLLALSSPYGDNPLFWNLTKQTKERKEDAARPTNPEAQKAILASSNQYKVSPRPVTKMRPKSLHSLINGGKTQLFDGLEDDFSFSDDTFVPRKSVKNLVLRKSLSNKSSSTSFYSDGAGLPNSTDRGDIISITRPLEQAETSVNESISELPVYNQEITPVKTPAQQHKQIRNPDDTMELLNNKKRENNNVHKISAVDTTSFLENSDLDASVLAPDGPPHPTGIKLRRPGYYCTPSLDEMISMIDDSGNCFIEDLAIGREGYGCVLFPGITNVTDMDLDDIVHFRRKEVVIYPDDDKKPPLGEGLNKKAEITLDCVWPRDKSSKSPIRSPDRLKTMNYTEKLEEITARLGAKFIDYRPETGSWVFQVNHFSKYGLLDDSDEEDLLDQQKKLAAQKAKDLLLVQKVKMQQEKLIEKELSQKNAQDATTLKQIDDAGIINIEKQLEFDEDFELSPKLAKDKFMTEMEDDDFEMGMDSKFAATAMGLSARKIQSMKASFFGEDMSDISVKKERRLVKQDLAEVEEMRSLWKRSGESMNTSLFGAFKHPASLSLPQSPAFSDKEGYESVYQKPALFEPYKLSELRPTPQTFKQPPVIDYKVLPSGIQPEDEPLRIVGTKIRHAILNVKDSLLYQNQMRLVDAGCFMGHSFRVGWGPCWTLVHSGQSMGSEEETESSSILPSNAGRVRSLPKQKSWKINVEEILVADHMTHIDADLLKQQEDLMEIELDHSLVSQEEGTPIFAPAPGNECLHKLHEKFSESLLLLGSHPDLSSQEHMKTVFGLCVALWGELPGNEDLDKYDIYREQQMRREALSKWLAESSAKRVAEEMEASPVINAEGCLLAMFSKMTVRSISEACMLAQKVKDHRLALLISQASATSSTRHLIGQQLTKWSEVQAFKFISDVRLKIYSLLAGQLVWESSDKRINTCEALDWKRALALHLWYKCAPNSSVQQALIQYQNGFLGSEESQAYCAPPLPPYLEQEGLDEGEHIYDTVYHLLCLYANNTYGLEALLSPTSSVPSHIDFRLSWHLLETLEALSYSHVSPHQADSIHVGFSSQLESLGLWHWAAFVLLHIRDGYRRQQAVEALLLRHIRVGDLADKEQFLVDKLQVSPDLIHKAKAIKASYEGDFHAEAKHWLLASQWNKAHQTIIKHLAADAIINDEHEYLKDLLSQLSPVERSLGILNWSQHGKVFFDFLVLKSRLEALKEQPEPTLYDLEELQPAVMSLCTRVKGLNCSSARDRLCQAEMSKTASSLLQTFLTIQGKPQADSLIQLIPELPMPEDYALQDLHVMDQAYIMDY